LASLPFESLTPELLSSFVITRWKDYELLDSGKGRKLERFGKVVTIRPEIHANGPTKLSLDTWQEMAAATFTESRSGKGTWINHRTLPKNWHVQYKTSRGLVTFALEQTKFKHVGLFPEQATNWEFIAKRLAHTPDASMLNLFAYTGAASVVARSVGAEVTHVDSIRQVVSWSKKNMELSGLSDIRWIVEDALKFAHRAIKRCAKYDGLVMDPPTFGLGPKGERWKIEDKLGELLNCASQLIKPNGFLILNTYSAMDATVLKALVQQYFPNRPTEIGPLILKARSGTAFETGTLVRVG
jgi:23S rRNA (cytosine1962-C5)-methyltransferase